MPIVAGLDVRAFQYFAQLSGLVPLVGIASGHCFAGNAALLGCCDVVIATEDASIGIGGPAMIEGGGLGSYHPSEVGPIDVQYGNGVVDLRVADDTAAVTAARRYLSYFRRTPPAPTPERAAPDQTRLRDLIPTNRKRVYAVRDVIVTLLEDVLELRAGFGPGLVTALARVDGQPLGGIANDPMHLGGAIDADGADKAARFMQLCDAYSLPLLFLADTPGFMVGPAAERTATVRHVSRMFVTGANLRVPTGTVVLRKGYGLGAQAMAGGSFKAPLFCVGWPTSEFGGWPPTSRSTTSSIRRIPGAGSRRCSTTAGRTGPSSPASAAHSSTPIDASARRRRPEARRACSSGSHSPSRRRCPRMRTQRSADDEAHIRRRRLMPRNGELDRAPGCRCQANHRLAMSDTSATWLELKVAAVSSP